MFTLAELRASFDYDPETGVFRRLYVSGGRGLRKTGSVSSTTGYLGIRFKHQRYDAHRLAWFYVHGEWPEGYIDHINGDKLDNRICNLRQATMAQNMRNMDAPAHNSSGVKGVCFDKANQKWMAYVQVNGKFKNLGRFANKLDAWARHTAYCAEHFGEFARPSPAPAL